MASAETLRHFCPVLRQGFLLALLLAAAAADIRKKRIPNRLLLAALAGRVLLGLLELSCGILGTVPELVGIWLDSMLLTAAFFLLSMLFRKALGMGDVKLMGILALFLGAGEACRCFYRGLLTAAAVSLTLLAGKRIRIEEGIAFAPFLLAGYLLALWMQLRERLYQVSVFPLMLIFAGGLNHLLVLAARWIFENSSYGMSSRYALQYQAGILGVVLTFGLFYQVRQRKEGGSFWTVSAKWAALSISLAILAGNGYTTVKELEKAPHRKAYGMKVAEAALNYREVADDELEALFQYHHGPEKIRNALRILEENGWNVYRGR